LIASEVLTDNYLFACFAADIPALWSQATMPLNLVFHRDGNRWRTRWFASARGAWDARRLTPTQMGQRAIRAHLLRLRFGEMPRDVWIAMQEAQSKAFATEEAAQHGFPQPMIDAFTRPEHLMTLRLLRGLEWPDVEKLVFTELDDDSFADPEDFEIAFFLEAGEQTLLPLTLAGPTRATPLVVEPYPCLCDVDVDSARLEGDSLDAPAAVALNLTRFGRHVLEQARRLHEDRRWVVTSGGRIVTVVPVSVVTADGPIMVRGSWERGEAEDVVRELNAYRDGIDDLIRARIEEEAAAGPRGVSKAVSVPAGDGGSHEDQR
jgi:hypothetical protein